MERKIFLLQGQEKELEQSIGFTYTSSILFENRQEIEMLIKNREVALEALKLGKRFGKLEGKTPRCTVRWLGDAVGYGLFAEEKISKGAFVGEYTGRVRQKSIDDRTNNYLYQYPLEDETGFVIDAGPVGNHTRFINHSAEPNLQPRNAFWNGFYHKILIALQPISPGTQLTYNYGPAYWYIRDPPIEF